MLNFLWGLLEWSWLILHLFVEDGAGSEGPVDLSMDV